MNNQIEITFKGMKEKVHSGTTLADLIVLAGENDKGLIVERNNHCVYPHVYSTTVVTEGDRIELINPDFGG
ncbi:MAG: MoaD/ThiS family protein [Syntrophorhabdus sp.]